jgi:hypothetical protein
MKITKKGTNVKRHTTSYLAGGKWRSRKETYALAKDGKIEGVYACKGEHEGYIQSSPASHVKLYDLPSVVRD